MKLPKKVPKVSAETVSGLLRIELILSILDPLRYTMTNRKRLIISVNMTTQPIPFKDQINWLPLIFSTEIPLNKNPAETMAQPAAVEESQRGAKVPSLLGFILL